MEWAIKVPTHIHQNLFLCGCVHNVPTSLASCTLKGGFHTVQYIWEGWVVGWAHMNTILLNGSDPQVWPLTIVSVAT